jgi:hypothetical protein
LTISGINLHDINYQNIHIKELYIKIDKKLIINANNIKIVTKKDNTKTNYSKINKIIKNNFLYLNYLQKVDIKNIQINENSINYLRFSNNELQIDTNLLYINASFTPKSNQINFLIHKITYKPMDINLENIKGYEQADLFKLKLYATYKYKKTNFDVNLNLADNIKYSANIKNLNNELINQFTPMLKDNNVTLNADNLSITGNENKANFIIDDFDFLMNTIKINSLKLSGKLDLTNNNLTLQSQKLIVNKNINIDRLSLEIKNNLITTKFYTTEILNKKVISLLKKFNLNIPIYQANGKNNVFIKLIYNTNSKKIESYIKANILNSKLMLSKNSYLTLKKANLELNNSIITLNNSFLNYKQSIINFDYYLKKGVINLTKNFIKTKGNIKSLNIENIGKITKYPENIYINLNKLSIYLRNLKTNILIGKNVVVKLNKLSRLYPYIKYMREYQILEGNTIIKISNKVDINTNITNTKQQILAKHFGYLKNIKINTKIKNDNITIKNKNFRINIINKNPMKIDAGIKNIDINITKFVQEALENNKTKSNKKDKVNQKYIVNLKGLNTNIIYNDTILYSHYLSIHYDKNYINIESLDNDRNISIIKKNHILKIYGFNIRNKDLKKLANIDFIKDAKINFFALQTKYSPALNGFIEINRGYIKELKTFNNILAFINVVPSLVTFHGAGFSGKGFKIRYGHIDYIYNEGILYIKKADIRGDNLKLKAQGYIDLVTKTIKMNVDATIIVKLIKDIPIVNYIILGKNGGITLKLKVSGKLSDPKVEKNLAKEAIKAPFGIIKRTLITPFRLFMKDEE